MVSQLPAAHALSGCDTAAQCFGVGIYTILKVLNSGIHLNKLGDLSKDIGHITKEPTVFMAACYGVRGIVNMSEVSTVTCQVGQKMSDCIYILTSINKQ
jgi:hypothetical protein